MSILITETIIDDATGETIDPDTEGVITLWNQGTRLDFASPANLGAWGQKHLDDKAEAIRVNSEAAQAVIDLAAAKLTAEEQIAAVKAAADQALADAQAPIEEVTP